MTEEIEQKKTTNVQNEILLVGSLYNNPDLFVSYGSYMRSQYDFSDIATKFFYDLFAQMYTTFSQTFDETQINIFVSQDSDRMRMYKQLKGYKTISQWKELANVEDFKNYYDIVKKYSLIREYERNGYPVQRLLNHNKFNFWTAQDIYKLIRAKADKINTVINAGEESVVLSSGTEAQIRGYLIKPDMGISMPWKLLNAMFRGCLLGKMAVNCFLSNNGKSRNMILLACYIVFIHNEKFLLLSNEMDEPDLKNCLIATVLNNKCFQELHGVHRNKPENEIVLGVYKDDKGEIIKRYEDEDGEFTESEEDYIARVERDSSEYRDIMKVSKWIDDKRDGKLFFKDVSTDYSDEALELEFKKHKMIYDIKYCGYDTLKGYRTDDWSTIKQTATRLKEIMKELKMFCWTVFQLSDDSLFTDIFQLSSNNLTGSKQIKHVVDSLMLGKKIEPEEYHKYQYMSTSDWGEPHPHELDLSKKYFAIKVDKNRGGNKDFVPLFELNLDYNTWDEVGYLIKK